jgi:hypothetical protein
MPAEVSIVRNKMKKVSETVNAFKNRGHFCNYCRKILCNKVKDKQFYVININEIIWYAWDHPEYTDEILESIKNLNADCTNKQFNNQLKAIMAKYGFTNKKTDYERKKNYGQKAQEERGNER